ncbi:MAG: hypothetical protein FJX78_03000 [Armatimonadetes bacterium]|nr:hypothetical protein [Armatimonadota bacterium]
MPFVCRILDPDVLSATRLRDQLARAGWRTAKADERPDAVLINLARGDAASVVRSAAERWPAAKLVGFCGHADLDRRTAALAAGCGVVLTHGEAMTRLGSLFGRLLGDDDGG